MRPGICLSVQPLYQLYSNWTFKLTGFINISCTTNTREHLPCVLQAQRLSTLCTKDPKSEYT